MGLDTMMEKETKLLFFSGGLDKVHSTRWSQLTEFYNRTIFSELLEMKLRCIYFFIVHVQ